MRRFLAGLTGGLTGLCCWSLPVACGASVVGFVLQAVASGESSERTSSEWFWYGFLYFGLFFIIPLGLFGVVTGIRYGLEAEAGGEWAGVYVPRKYGAMLIELNRQARERRALRSRVQHQKEIE